METLNINDKQGIEICGNVGQMLLDGLNSEDVWNRVERMLVDCLKNNNINMDASDLTDKLEWSVKARLKKISFDLKPGPISYQPFLGGDRFGG